MIGIGATVAPVMMTSPGLSVGDLAQHLARVADERERVRGAGLACTVAQHLDREAVGGALG